MLAKWLCWLLLSFVSFFLCTVAAFWWEIKKWCSQCCSHIFYACSFDHRKRDVCANICKSSRQAKRGRMQRERGRDRARERYAKVWNQSKCSSAWNRLRALLLHFRNKISTNKQLHTNLQSNKFCAGSNGLRVFVDVRLCEKNSVFSLLLRLAGKINWIDALKCFSNFKSKIFNHSEKKTLNHRRSWWPLYHFKCIPFYTKTRW